MKSEVKLNNIYYIISMSMNRLQVKNMIAPKIKLYSNIASIAIGSASPCKHILQSVKNPVSLAG